MKFSEASHNAQRAFRKYFVLPVRGLAAEFVGIVRAAAVYFHNLEKSERKAAALKGRASAPCTQTPVLLVHGYLHNSSGWGVFKKRLQDNGITNVYTINLGHPFQSIEGYAAKVAAKAKEIEKETGRKDLTLVGHSMGGLVSSYYATAIDTEKKVKEIVTIGSPLKGTYLGYIGVGKSAKQMRFNSPFVQDLQKRIAAATHIRFLHIRTNTDLVIVPQSSATLKGGANTTAREIKGTGHLAMLFSKRVFKEVLNFLKPSQKLSAP